MANTSILAAFERMWQHVVAAIGSKADYNHTHENILSDIGVASTVTELNYMDGVTSNVQTQIDNITDAKADWNQNDSAQLDYIKNRPFYTGDPVETVIAEGTIPANGMMQTSATIAYLVLGETYKAVFDGTTYDNLVCEDYDGLPSIMNDSFMFAIQSGRAMAYAANGSVSHSLKVMSDIPTVVPLERKYIAEYIDTIAGERVEGKTYTIDDESVTADKGAEVFNDYDNNIASGQYSHAEGVNNIASGAASHAEGYDAEASGSYSHAEGYGNTASGSRSHAEGWSTEATGQASHAENFATHATGQFSHAEGDNATASGRASHAEGYGTDAVADYSHAEGMNTNASSEYQHVQGKYNVIDAEDEYAHIVGNGSSNNSRSNAHTIDWSGNAWFAGNVKIGGTGYGDTNASELASVSYVDNKVQNASSVSFNRSLTSGTKVGTLTINGNATDIYAPTDTNTTYNNATTSAAGLMSASDKSKLDGITSSADSVSFSRSLTSGTKVGTLTINGTGTDLYAPSPNPSYVKDKTNSTATYLNYGASAVTSASYLAAWNGYELRGMTPADAFKNAVACGSTTTTMSYKAYDEAESIVDNETVTINWKWKKYPDGVCELVGQSASAIPVTIHNTWASGIYESDMFSVPLPSGLGLTSNPHITVSTVGGSAWLVSEGAVLSGNNVQAYFCRPTRVTSQQIKYYVNFHIIGAYS